MSKRLSCRRPTYEVLASNAINTMVWIGCWQARPEIDNSVEETLRLSQLSLLPSERNCLGRREEPRMLKGGAQRWLDVRNGIGGKWFRGSVLSCHR